MDIQQKTILVSGGGSGLGQATAARLVSEGANVVIVDVDQAKGAATAQTLGAQALFVTADVTDEERVQNAIMQAQAHFGALHGAVNCAGVAIGERITGKRGPHRLDSFAKVIHVNLIGSFNVLRLAATAIAQNEPGSDGERGVIVNTASVAAFDGQIGQAAYAASKGGIVGLTLPAARDLAAYGIRVVTIAPGLFDTPLMAGLPEAARVSLGEQVPFPSRLGQPPEYAALVSHIFANRMLNGEVIRLDGALRMAPR
ncbi:MAG: SDR family NAD(P)-dependent oxidoreductase [Caldilinea sp. CFX5]|nr:SDR family NAD(P)-dependent oxidoreductase [Caldilinea sp. CFX5]